MSLVFRRRQHFGVLFPDAQLVPAQVSNSIFFPFSSPYPALILHSAHLLQPVERELRLVGLSAGPGIHQELLLAYLVPLSRLIIFSQPCFLTQFSHGTTQRELNILCAPNVGCHRVLMACGEAR